MHFFGDLTGAVCLLDDYVWRTTQYHYRGQNREHREDDQTKPVINKNEIIISNIWNTLKLYIVCYKCFKQICYNFTFFFDNVVIKRDDESKINNNL